MIDRTTPSTSPLPSLVLVCPSNWGSATFTDIIAVKPSLKSSPVNAVFTKLLDVAYALIVLVKADLNPETWVPPSTVLILLT